jgi:nicotinamidase/pyrazinamidase
MDTIQPTPGDALVIVDVQNDFLPGGNLAVQAGDEVIPVLNRYIGVFNRRSLPIYATRDWHPADHCSFKPQGGIWPPHCIAGSAGARFPAALKLPYSATIVSKATTPEKDAYSGFEGTGLADQLKSRGIERLFIGGLATDYCVLNTVIDALSHGFKVQLLLDAIRAVNLQPGDGQAAINVMLEHGAVLIDQAKATYKNGVLRVELPKANIGAPRKLNIKVD